MRHVLLSGMLSAIVPLMAVVAPAAGQSSTDELSAVRQDIARRKQAGAYGEAAALAEHALALSEKRFGRDNPDTSLDLDELGQLYHSAGRFSEAEAIELSRDLRRLFGLSHAAKGTSFSLA
jgi:hypothetical protein